MTKRTKQIKGYVTPEELETIKLQASLEGLTQSEYLTKQALKPSDGKDGTTTGTTNEQLIEVISKLVSTVQQLTDKVENLEARLDKGSTTTGTTIDNLSVGSFISGEQYHKVLPNAIEVSRGQLTEYEQHEFRLLGHLSFLPELGVLVTTEYSQRQQARYRVLKIIGTSCDLPEYPTSPDNQPYDLKQLELLEDVLENPTELSRHQLAEQIANSEGKNANSVIGTLGNIGGKQMKKDKILSFTKGYLPTDDTRETWYKVELSEVL